VRTLAGALAAALWVLMCSVVFTPALAQGLESALSPGPLIKGHAKWQDECASCHVRFDRAAQDRLCQDCHKPVAQDIRAGTGFHGRQKPQACRSCPTDHKGREMHIAPLNTREFDHKQTDWLLRGAHAEIECASCHLTGKAWREAPQDCLACHRKDDTHKGSLGKACADCHTERNWKEAKFDHATTRFALKGKHTEVKCADCHPNGKYKDVPMSCNGCHREDDKHKTRYGSQCENCHEAKSWKSISFNHDLDTRYALKGKHRSVRCDSCHTGNLYRDKLASDCLSCHRKDDKHQGSLGVECAACHVETGWKETGRFDHDRSRFPLLGKHAGAECKDCHQPAGAKAAVYRNTPMACVACHRKDDKHQATLGEACGSCHGERSWKVGRFDHEVTRFALRGAHASPKLACTACHRDLKSYRDTPRECIGCHRKDDKHEGNLGTACESCHNDQRWTVPRFDHGKARFALLGAHAKVECKACHTNLRYRDTPSDCLACHRKQDQHKGRLGERCDSCHNARHWNLVQFDHQRQTRYALTGKHQSVACEACHRAPAPKGQKIAAVGSDCASCHRGDDPHDSAFGSRCEVCHQTSGWKNLLARRPMPNLAQPPGNASSGVRP
jgi:hypothetical protein